MVYRYCLTTTAQSGQDCHNVVVFGECLNQVFGAPATELQRWVGRGSASKEKGNTCNSL